MIESHNTSKSALSHKDASRKRLKLALFTVSSSRYKDTKRPDETGERARELCRRAGQELKHETIDDNKQMIRVRVLRALFEKGNDAAILMGGTGLAPRDVTIEAIKPLLDKELNGFGEIFRTKSYEEIGTPAMMTRAIAGSIENKIVFCLPGSPDAVRIGILLALQELPHAVFIAGSKP